MKYFFSELLSRNLVLYFFGWFCVAGTLVTFLLWMTTHIQVNNINAWIKPFKFFLSTSILMWTLAWFLGYLPETVWIKVYVWVTVVVFLFELIYISWKAGQGELSHFNISSAFHGSMFTLMGAAISIFTLYTAYIGWLFFTNDFPELPVHYVYAIRFGLFIFVIFAFEGGIMGSRLGHTVGAPDGGVGLPLMNWSMTHGDLRVAHFIGMHALQILPLMAFYIFHNSKVVIFIGTLYFILALVVLIQALNGIPLIKTN